ncbi:hypothetical protein FRC18_006745 [Serendipita sp. 400]|nr:hypothetical protein FRC18_006745 [Serendipita sp. 400]
MYNPCHMSSPNPGRTLNNIQFGPPPRQLSFTHPYTMSTNSTIENINTPKNAQLTSILSHAVKAYGPGLIFCSGCTPHDSALAIVEGGIKEHTEQVIQNLTNVLESAGSSWQKVVKVNVYLTDMNDFGAMNEVYERLFNRDSTYQWCRS